MFSSIAVPLSRRLDVSTSARFPQCCLTAVLMRRRTGRERTPPSVTRWLYQLKAMSRMSHVHGAQHNAAGSSSLDVYL